MHLLSKIPSHIYLFVCANLFHVRLNIKHSDLAFGIQRCTCISFNAEYAAEGLRGSIIFSLTFLWTVDASAGSLSNVWADRGVVCGFLLTSPCKLLDWIFCYFLYHFLLVFNVVTSN